MPSCFGAYLRHAQHYLQVAQNISKVYLQGNENVLQAIAMFDMEFQDIINGQTWTALHWETNEATARLCNTFPEALAEVADLRIPLHQWIEHVETALNAARHLNEREDESIHLSYLGTAYAELADAEKAIQYLEQTLAIDREIDHPTNEGADLLHLGNVYADFAGDIPKSMSLYNQALEIAQKAGNERLEGSVWGQLGNSHGYLDEQSQAIECYERALHLAQKIGDKRSEANWLGNQATAYRAKGEPNRAIELYEQALKISKELGDRRNEGKHIGNIGITHYHLDDLPRAIEFLEQALAIARDVVDRRSEQSWLGNLGHVYRTSHELHQAIDYYDQAIIIAREIDDKMNEEAWTSNIGAIWVRLHEFEKAIAPFERALESARAMGNEKLGEIPKALEWTRSALDAFKRIESPFVENAQEQLERLQQTQPGN